VIPGITPETVGRYRPADLLGAIEFFEAKYLKRG